MTAPASPYKAIDDLSGTLGLPTTVVVSGTTNSTAPGVDTVDLVCTSGGGGSQSLGAGVTLASDGTFSATVTLVNLSIGRPCVIRALPTGTSSRSWPRFAGPKALVGQWSITAIVGGPNAAALSTFVFNQVEARGVVDLTAAGQNAVNNAIALGFSGESANDPAAAEFALRPRREFGQAPNASLLVDGQSGYSTFAAITRVNDQTPGVPVLTVAPSLTVTGSTLVESGDIVRCNDEAACTAFVPTGIRFERTYALGADGRRQRVQDRFVSTDGLAHDIDVAYTMDGDASEYGFAIAGSTIFERRQETVLTFPSGPVSIIGRETDDEPGEGGEAYGSGFTWHAAPELRFAGSSADDFEALFVRQIPAGGEAGLDMALAVGWGIETIRDLVLEHENELSDPSVAIAAPATGTATIEDRILVTGTVQAPRALGVLSRPTVLVNGLTAVVTADGTWSVDVPLPVGANTLTAVATNSAGRTGSAASSVVRTALAGPPAPVTTTITNTVAATVAAVAPLDLSARIVGKARRTRTVASYTLFGRLQRPTSVPATAACQGWVRLTLTRNGGRPRSAWTAIRSNCTYQRTLAFARGSGGTVVVTARFTGTEHLLAITAGKVQLRPR